MKTISSVIKNNQFFLISLAVLLIIHLRLDIFYIKTGSMEPVLPVGTIVVVDSHAKPEIGAVFAYRSGKIVIIHRLIAAKEDGLLFQGDANSSADSIVLKEQVIGKVILNIKFFVPLLKWLGMG